MHYNGIFCLFGPKISKFKVDALPHEWTYRPDRWLKMTLAASSTKQEPKKIVYLSPFWSIGTLNVTVNPKIGQNSTFLGQSTPLKVEKKFRYPLGDLRSIQLYSKFQIFSLYGSLGPQKRTHFRYWALWAPSGRQTASESKIPPFTTGLPDE